MKKLRKVIYIGLLSAICSLFLITPPLALGQSAEPGGITDDQVNAIAKELYCPVCENVPLDVCGTQACEQWRQLIRQKLAEGWSEAQIKQYFVDQYGDRVLATPPPRGINWLVYLIPPIAVLAGVFILYRAFMAWKRPLQVESPSLADPQVEDYLTRIEAELKKR
ncbi:MAG: cytochrome c-type biogenesis protein [Chloroflexota bacterium]